MNKLCVFISVCLTTIRLTAGFFDDYVSYNDLLIFPHQLTIADIICTGTVTTNINRDVSKFAVDDVIWGKIPSTNITIKCINELNELSFDMHGRYLLFAFTNNWWSEMEQYHIGYHETSTLFLSEFLSITNLPQNQTVFSDCRIMDPERSAIKFSKFNLNGTNYWDSTRTFITNFLNITRIQQDEVLAFRNLDSILKNPVNHNYYPRWLRKEFTKYWFLRYNGVEPEQP